MKRKGSKHMETLKQIIKNNLAALQTDDNAKMVFWKEGEEWNAFSFVLKPNNHLSKYDTACLFDIRDIDSEAVVISIRDFYRGWYDDLMTLDEMVDVIEYRRTITDYHNNINVFLEGLNTTKQYRTCTGNDSYDTASHQQQKTEQEPTTLKFNKDEFLKSELGQRLVKYTEYLYHALYQCSDDWLTALEGIKNSLNAMLLSVKQCYGIQYHFIYSEYSCGLFSPDKNDWLYVYMKN